MTRRIDPTLLHAAISRGLPFAQAFIYPSGAVIEREAKAEWTKPRGERGTIDGFSAMSRRRLMERIIRIEWARQQAVFITLTYPGEYSRDPVQWKRDLNRFRQWLVGSPQLAFQWAIWRLEFQKRGAPHYHLVVGCAARPYIASFRNEVRSAWSLILDLAATAGHYARVDVQAVDYKEADGPGPLLDYLAKYVGKRQPTRRGADPETGEIPPCGRVWGQWGEPPLAPPATLKLTAHGYVTFVRRLRRWAPKGSFLAKANVGMQSFLAFLSPNVVRQLARGL